MGSNSVGVKGLVKTLADGLEKTFSAITSFLYVHQAYNERETHALKNKENFETWAFWEAGNHFF